MEVATKCKLLNSLGIRLPVSQGLYYSSCKHAIMSFCDVCSERLSCIPSAKLTIVQCVLCFFVGLETAMMVYHGCYFDRNCDEGHGLNGSHLSQEHAISF